MVYTLTSIRYGLDLVNGAVRDNKKAGVYEPAISKIKSLKFATEAAITILRIDDMIKLAPEAKEDRWAQLNIIYYHVFIISLVMIMLCM